MTPRDVARRVLERVDREGAWATPALDGELARAGLDDRDRRLASELVYGVLRHRTRIDRALGAHADLKKTPPRVLLALRIAAYQLLFLDRVPAYAAVDDAVAAAREASGPKLGGFVNAVLRKLGAEKEPPLPVGGKERIEVEASMPAWIIDELIAATSKDEALVRAVAFAHSAPLVGRANTRKTTRAALLEELAAAGVTATPLDLEVGTASQITAAAADGPGSMAPAVDDSGTRAPAADNSGTRTPAADNSGTRTPAADNSGTRTPAVDNSGTRTPAAFVVEGLGDPARNAAFMAGRWTVQDSGAQLVAQIAVASSQHRASAGLRILDACAGVGGKSTHLAELTDDAAQIDGADLNATKLGLLAETAERLGLHSIRRVTCDLLDPNAPLADAYDIIVLDAPCSGLGVLRRHPDAKWRLKPADVPRLADLQRQLLDAVVPRLAPGGTFIYSVCTFTRAEGPDQAAAFAARHGLRVALEHRSWPPQADAFYVARLERPA